MKVIIGLGNPGRAYRNTRHNIGFSVVDALAKRLNAKVTKKQWRSKVGKGRIAGEEVIMVKPQTFMNCSGHVVMLMLKNIADRIKLEDILAISDDINLELGKIRLRTRGSSGGHRGLESIIDNLNTDKFCRLRVGIKPKQDLNLNLNRLVLAPFKRSEIKALRRIIEASANASIMWIKEGPNAVMNKYNGVDIIWHLEFKKNGGI